MYKFVSKFIKYYLPPLIWGVLIFSVSSGPVPSVSEVYWENFVAHKIAHVIEYGILAILIYRAFLPEKISKRRIFIYTLIIAFLYGLNDEFHQSFTPSREPRFRDVIIDTIGAAIGVLVVWKLLPKMDSKLVNLGKKLGLV